jgi:hypothetical protein
MQLAFHEQPRHCERSEAIHIAVSGRMQLAFHEQPRHCERSEAIHIPGLHGLPRFSLS